MKCQKCAKPAVVHLTEVVTECGGENGDNGKNRTVEIHLCLDHAVEAGLLTPIADAQGGVGMPIAIKPEKTKSKVAAEAAGAGASGTLGAIVPAPAEPSSLAVSRNSTTADTSVCPVCGMNWSQFKQGGLMGCPHDYEQFAGKLLPLIKRSHEGSTDHIGKVPPRRKTEEGQKQVITLRLRRELQKAVDAEKYEEAAALRDQLRQMEI